MEDLLRVRNIVINIASNLNTRDYVNFRQVNKKVHDIHLSDDTDNEIWSQKLLLMGIKKEQTQIAENQEVIHELEFDNEKELDCVTIFKDIKSFREKDAKRIYIKFYRCFQPYCNKLKSNSLAHFFPQKYDDDPLIQVKIFSYISRYNKGNKNEFDEYQKIDQNLNMLKEIFINSVLQEMDANFAKENYSQVGKFIQVLLLSHEERNAVEFFRSKADPTFEMNLPGSVFYDDETLNEKSLDEALEKVKDFLNSKIELVDTLFADTYPVILEFTESFIQENFLDYMNEQFGKEESRLQYMPEMYSKTMANVCGKLKASKNGGEFFGKVVKEFFDMYLEPKIVTYLEFQPRIFQKSISNKLDQYKDEAEAREKEQNEQIYNSLRDQSVEKNNITDDKNDFLSSFTKIFKLTNSERQKNAEQLQLAYNLNLLNNNLQNIKSLVSLDLCYNIVQQAQTLTDQMYTFHQIEKIVGTMRSRCQEIFKILINELGWNHIKPGFEKATVLLQKYDSNEIQRVELKLEGVETQVEPLVQFTELINIGDIILQMISIFYRNELIQKCIIDKNRDFLNDVVQAKKNFETMLDDFVAEGLNIGINKLMDEVDFVFNTIQLPDDYNPNTKQGEASSKDIKPTQCALKNIELLNNHAFLLTGATDKGTIDVYKQEIGERFFNELVKHIKKSLISPDGAIFLICDLNLYYDFIATKLKQKRIVPLFAALKNVAQLYIISGKDSKELGKMISDVGRFQGIFSQEEVYEFVERRSDWVRVKRDVEKVMYGLGVKDCTIM